MSESTNNTGTPQVNEHTVSGRCISCQHWSRSSIYDWPNEDKKSNIGICSKLEDTINYWDGVDVAETKIEDGMIGAVNLYTHQNFGCIHYNVR